MVSTVSGHHKNTLGRASARSGHVTKLEQFTFLRYLWVTPNVNKKNDAIQEAA
jgi:hypothetical protein